MTTLSDPTAADAHGDGPEGIDHANWFLMPTVCESYHESGHAVLAQRLNCVIWHVSIVRELMSFGRTRGHVKVSHFPSWEAEVLVFLAGGVAQSAFTASATDQLGDETDREHVHELLRQHSSNPIADLERLTQQTDELVYANAAAIAAVAKALVWRRTLNCSELWSIIRTADAPVGSTDIWNSSLPKLAASVVRENKNL
jgi:hypothetical protein